MKKKLKLVIVANTSNFFRVFMLNHIEQLSKNYDIYICCSNSIHLKKLLSKKVNLVEINFKRGINLFHDFIAFISTLLFFLKNKPDLSISFTPKIGFIVSISSFLARTPNRIHWYTGQIWVNKNGFAKFFFRCIDKLIYLLSHNVLVDSISQKKFLIREKIISKKNSFVLNKGSVGGVNLKKFKFNKKKGDKLRKNLSITNDTFIFLYIGRINKDKGVIDLIEAFKKIDTIHNSILIFVGPIEDEELTNLIYKKKNILYFKYSTTPEYWFSAANILCLPSYREGFGTVVIEAAACRLPTLCSNIYGLKDAVIANKTGFFHKSGSIHGIKKKMLFAIKNKYLLKKFGSIARKRVLKDFKDSVVTKKLSEFILLKLK